MRESHTLLHFTSVLSTKDNHLLLSEVDRDRGGGGHAGSEAVGRESTGVVDCVVGVEVLELLAARPDEHVAHEESMVGASADNANVDAVALIPAGETIDNVDAVAGVEVVDSALAVDTPDLFGKDCQLFGSTIFHLEARESGGEVEASPAKSRCREVPMEQGPIDWRKQIAGSAFGSGACDVCRLPRACKALDWVSQ